MMNLIHIINCYCWIWIQSAIDNERCLWLWSSNANVNYGKIYSGPAGIIVRYLLKVRFSSKCKQSISNIFLICHILWHFQDGRQWPWEFHMGQKLKHAPISLKIVSSCSRGIGQYFRIFFLAKFHLSGKIWLLIYKYKKKIQKFLLKVKKSSISVKHA